MIHKNALRHVFCAYSCIIHSPQVKGTGPLLTERDKFRLNWESGAGFKIFNRFSIEINVFLLVNAKQGCVNNVSGVYLVIFSLLLIGQDILIGSGHFCRQQPLLPIGWRIFQTVPVHQRQGKFINKALLTLHWAPATRQSTFIIDLLYST